MAGREDDSQATERIWNDLPDSGVAGGSLKVNTATPMRGAGRRHIDQWTRIAPQRLSSGPVSILISDHKIKVGQASWISQKHTWPFAWGAMLPYSPQCGAWGGL